VYRGRVFGHDCWHHGRYGSSPTHALHRGGELTYTSEMMVARLWHLPWRRDRWLSAPERAVIEWRAGGVLSLRRGRRCAGSWPSFPSTMRLTSRSRFRRSLTRYRRLRMGGRTLRPSQPDRAPRGGGQSGSRVPSTPFAAHRSCVCSAIRVLISARCRRAHRAVGEGAARRTAVRRPGRVVETTAVEASQASVRVRPRPPLRHRTRLPARCAGRDGLDRWVVDGAVSGIVRSDRHRSRRDRPAGGFAAATLPG
jgi:hypothetical protein